MIFYRSAVPPQCIIDDYLKIMKYNHEPHSTSGIYMSLLVFCFKYRSEHYTKHMQTNIATLFDRSQELIGFIKLERVNYKVLIRTLFEQYGHQNTTTHKLEQLEMDFTEHANQWFSSKEEPNDTH